jgi:hypothetical protein
MIVKLQTAWTARLKLRAEGDKLRAEGAKVWAGAAKVWAEGDKLWAEGAKLWAEGDKLRAEGAKLWAEGDRLWAEMIIAVHGNITLKWTWRGDVEVCTLGTGETFRGDQPIEGE